MLRGGLGRVSRPSEKQLLYATSPRIERAAVWIAGAGPSEKQLLFAISLAQKANLGLSADVLADKRACSTFIDSQVCTAPPRSLAPAPSLAPPLIQLLHPAAPAAPRCTPLHPAAPRCTPLPPLRSLRSLCALCTPLHRCTVEPPVHPQVSGGDGSPPAAAPPAPTSVPDGFWDSDAPPAPTAAPKAPFREEEIPF